jgi:hypothetical protein
VQQDSSVRIESLLSYIESNHCCHIFVRQNRIRGGGQIFFQQKERKERTSEVTVRPEIIKDFKNLIYKKRDEQTVNTKSKPAKGIVTAYIVTEDTKEIERGRLL